MTESVPPLQTDDRTVGALRIWVLLTVSIIPTILGIVLSVIISQQRYSQVSELLAGFMLIITNVFLIAYPVFWGLSAADESRLMRAFLRNAKLPPLHEQFVFLSFLVSSMFGVVLGAAILAMIPVALSPNQALAAIGLTATARSGDAWQYLFRVFVVYTVIDLVSWVVRQWFLRNLISDSPSLSDYYLHRRHIRRLVAQCISPALLLCVAEFSPDTGAFLSIPAYGVFLASTVYSEAVIASWRTQMKKDLRLESESLRETLDQMVGHDRILKTALYAAFLISVGTLVVWSVNTIIQRFPDVEGAAYALGHHTFGLLGPASLAIAFGAAAFLFKLQSPFTYGLTETLVGVIFIKHTLPDPLSADGLDIVRIFGSVFVFMRGLENSRAGLPKTRLGFATTIENFGQWKVFR